MKYQFLRLLIIFLALKVFASQKCITIESTNTNECISCARGFYREKDFFRGNSLLSSSESYFPLSECKEVLASHRERDFYVKPTPCSNSEPCDGTVGSPFGNIFKG
jgi:hypothetical protein